MPTFTGSRLRSWNVIAAMLAAAAGICPQCTLLVRPIFDDYASDDTRLPSAQPGELAAAIIDCIEAGARVINLTLALAMPSMSNEPLLQRALTTPFAAA